MYPGKKQPILGHAGIVGEFAVKKKVRQHATPKPLMYPGKKRPILGHAGLVGEFAVKKKSGCMQPKNRFCVPREKGKLLILGHAGIPPASAH